MLRYSQTLLRVSPFSLFMKDLAKTGALKKLKSPTREGAKLYRKLTPEKKASLKQRASRMSYPALDAYNSFQKKYASRFLHMSNKKRQREVAKLWAELKQKGTVKVPKAPKSAAAKVKKAAKKTKKAKK